MAIVRHVMADMNIKILRAASGIRPADLRGDANAMSRAVLKAKVKAAIIAAKAVSQAKAVNAKIMAVLKIKMKMETIAAKAAKAVHQVKAASGKIMGVLKIKIRAAITAVKAVRPARVQAIADAMNKDVLKASMKIIAVKAAKAAGDVHPLRKIGIVSAMSADGLKAKVGEVMPTKEVLLRGQAEAIMIRTTIYAVPVVRKITAKAIRRIKAKAAKGVPRLRIMVIRKMMKAVAFKMKTMNPKIKINGRGAARSRASLNIRAATKAVLKMKTMIIPLHDAIVSLNILKLAGN